MIDEICHVRVGTHAGAYYKAERGLIVCSRHRAQYEEQEDEFGPFNWSLYTPNLNTNEKLYRKHVKPIIDRLIEKGESDDD